jgi:hypothetical protein
MISIIIFEEDVEEIPRKPLSTMVNYRFDGSKGEEEDGFEVMEEIHTPLNFAEVKLFFCCWWW